MDLLVTTHHSFQMMQELCIFIIFFKRYAVIMCLYYFLQAFFIYNRLDHVELKWALLKNGTTLFLFVVHKHTYKQTVLLLLVPSLFLCVFFLLFFWLCWAHSFFFCFVCTPWLMCKDNSIIHNTNTCCVAFYFCFYFYWL